jgi:hypothetical protein
MSTPGFQLTDKAFADLLASFRMIPVEKDGAAREEVVEEVAATSEQKDAWIVRTERDRQSVMNGDDEEVERTTVTDTTDAYVRTRRWWQNPVKQAVMVATDNTPDTGKTTVEFIGSQAEVPVELR